MELLVELKFRARPVDFLEDKISEVFRKLCNLLAANVPWKQNRLKIIIFEMIKNPFILQRTNFFLPSLGFLSNTVVAVLYVEILSKCFGRKKNGPVTHSSGKLFSL